MRLRVCSYASGVVQDGWIDPRFVGGIYHLSFQNALLFTFNTESILFVVELI